MDCRARLVGTRSNDSATPISSPRESSPVMPMRERDQGRFAKLRTRDLELRSVLGSALESATLIPTPRESSSEVPAQWRSQDATHGGPSGKPCGK